MSTRDELNTLAAKATAAEQQGEHQWMPAIIAHVTFARAFGRAHHSTGDTRMLALFSALLVLLSLLATLPVGEGLR